MMRSSLLTDRGKGPSSRQSGFYQPAASPPCKSLGDRSGVPFQQSLRHLDRAYKNFFEGRAKYPAFKKRRNTQSATYASNAFTWEDGQLTLAKMDEPLAITFHRAFPKDSKPSSVTISKNCADRYFVSLLFEEEIKPLPGTSEKVGLDLAGPQIDGDPLHR